MVYLSQIGDNIKEVRKSKGMRQQDLSERCGFSNTTLSSYENNRKKPGIDTIATIAKHLGVSFERLYYGNENNAFISTAPDTGRKIVNSIYFLWEQGVIGYYKKNKDKPSIECSDLSSIFMLQIHKYHSAISRLLNNLREFQERRSTYRDPDTYLEMLLSSVAEEINIEIKRNEEVSKKKNEKKSDVKKGSAMAD